MEREIARLATSSWGVVTRRELLAAGITADEIRHRLHLGALLREYRGVYRVGHRAPSPEASYLAAVRACGDGAFLHGRPAGWLFGLLKGRPPWPEVTARGQHRIPGLKTRRCRKVDPRDVKVHRGVPTTTVPRTLVDLAAVLSLEQLTRACHEAGVLHATKPKHVEAVLERRPKSPGIRNLRAVIHGEVPVTLSKLERRFLALLDKHGLPRPVTNKPAGGKRLDCRWPDHKLTVELDSYGFHNSRYAWEQDRRREREAHARGDEFRRFTWGDVVEDQRLMLAELRSLLPSPI